MSDRTTRQSLSRAEELRQKRQQSSRVPVMPVKKTTPEPIQHPITNPFGKSVGQPIQQPVKRAAVVTTRSLPYSTPLRQSVATPVRRRVYRVDANGVETRFPSIPMIHFSWQWVSGFMTIVLLAAVLCMIYLPSFRVNNIQVDNVKRVPIEDIQKVIVNNTTSIFTVDRQKVENALGVIFVELTNIDLTVDLSGVVHLTAQERVPILAWYVGEYTYWIDAEGVLMYPLGEADSLLVLNSDSTLPLDRRNPRIKSAMDYLQLLISRTETPFTPETVLRRINPEVMKAAIALSAQMPSGASLVFDSISGMGWQDPRGWKVYFGLSLDDIQFKLVEYQAIVDRLDQIGITPTTISVAHVDSPYYRME